MYWIPFRLHIHNYNFIVRLVFCSFTNHISESAKDLSAILQTDDENSVTNQLYSDLFGDWLHFRPKTPDDELDVYGNFGEDFPQFVENASLTVDIQRLTDSDVVHDKNIGTSVLLASSNTNSNTNGKYSPKSTFDHHTVDNTFTSNPFSYECVQGSSQKNETYPIGSTPSPEYDDESSADELNLSGDSLPGGLTLSLGDNEANDKAIDTLLEECNGKSNRILLFFSEFRSFHIETYIMFINSVRFG